MAADTNIFLVPLNGIPQNFSINLAGTSYTLTVKYNAIIETWIMDIADANQNVLVAGLPFVTGTTLLNGLEYLGIDGDFVVYTDGNPTAIPTLDNLGVKSNLYFGTTATSNG